MTVKTVADELLGQMARKWRAVQEKVERGNLPPEQVLGALQAIHDGRFAAADAGTIVVPQRPRLIRGTFTPLEQQIINARAWKTARGADWADVPDAWFDTLGTAPAWPSQPHGCVVLEIALPDQPETKDAEGNTIPAIPGYIRTVRDLWSIISAQHPRNWKYEDFHLDAEHLFLLDGATYEPGLRWRVLDLGANWHKVTGIAPATVRNPVTSPNVDGFAALAHHPRFVRRMDGVRVPFTWISGFQVTVPGVVPRRGVPGVGFGRGERRVDLRTNWGGGAFPGSSVPSRLGV